MTVNAFSLDGRFHPLTVTDRVRADPPAFGVALAHVWPSALAPAHVGAAVEAAREAAAALGIENGPTYTQVVVGSQGAKVVELAARLGGGHDAELCEAALGVDLNELALAAALGEPIPPQVLAPLEPAGGAVTRFLTAPPGELRAVEGVDEALAVEGVARVRIYRDAGLALRRAAHRLGPRRRGAGGRRQPRAGAGAGRRRGGAHTLRHRRCRRQSSRLGGKPSSRFQPPAIGEEEIEAVAETLRSGWLTTGPRTAELEERFAEYVGAKHAVALSSGTAALHLSLLALGVGPGDEVITTPITWPATANVIVHAGATPVFVDVRDDDLNIDADLVKEAVTARTKAIMPVDLAGQPADLDPLLELGVPIIEDAAHAAESVYRGRKVGSIVDATCFSLYATKNIAAGEGGIVTTDRDDVAEAIGDRRLMRRGHGTLYDIGVPGYKANLSDVLASIALVQLGKVDAHRAIRERHVALYDAAVAELDGITPLARDPRDVHALHLYVVRDRCRRARARHVTSTSAHWRTRTSARRSTSCPCTG